MSKKTKIILIISTVIIIILTLVVSAYLLKIKKDKEIYESEKTRVKQYTSISEFQSVEEVLMYLDTELISKQEAKEKDVDYIFKVKFKYNLSLEDNNYFEKLIQYSASAIKYKNFYFIDEEKNVNILVMCNKEKQSITEYFINNEKFYFDKLENQKNINDFSKDNKIEVKKISKELQNIIDSNWKTTNLESASKDSIYRNYDIYFDEGFEIRKINGKIFNIIFTDKYKDNVIETLKTNSTNEEIINILGEPQFQAVNVIGYKTNKFYVFFSKDQISIYPIIEFETEKIIEAIEKYKNDNNLTLFINEVRNIWPDYDMYDYGENYVILQYSLKGIKFNFNNSSKRGVVFYNNYIGKIDLENTLEDVLTKDGQLPENEFFENKNLVFLQEQTRLEIMDDCSKYQNYAINPILNISNKFKTNIDTKTNIVRFISINKEYSNSELKEFINYGIWKDDYNFIYSIEGRGIYNYNAQTREYSTLIQGNKKYILNKIENNKLFYDETFIEL